MRQSKADLCLAANTSKHAETTSIYTHNLPHPDDIPLKMILIWSCQADNFDRFLTVHARSATEGILDLGSRLRAANHSLFWYLII